LTTSPIFASPAYARRAGPFEGVENLDHWSRPDIISTNIILLS
jgi:hypothetical protein